MTDSVVSIVDDDREFARAISRHLKRANYRTSMAHCAQEAREMVERVQPDVVLMDLNLPDADGGELVVELQKVAVHTKFIIITGYGSISSAVRTLKKGAVNYLTKPCDTHEILEAVRKATEEKKHKKPITTPPPHGHKVEDVKPCKADIVSASATMKRVMSLAQRVALRDTPVLLRGESGSGKDWLAAWIHFHSSRAEKKFFTINCAALTRELAESELFGHESGSFTGNRGLKKGMLELADGGTVLLNEIGEMDLILQAKLLTFLDTMSFVRVGGQKSISINARLFAATNQDLEHMVKEGRFRKDLYYRLSVLPIHVPNLHERSEDIPALAQCLLRDLAEAENLPTPTLEDGALRKLRTYSWPGNVRELRNVLAQAMMLMNDGVIRKNDIRIGHAKTDFKVEVAFPSSLGLNDIIQEVSRQIIAEALRRTSTKQDAAAMLGLTRHALTYQMKLLGL